MSLAKLAFYPPFVCVFVKGGPNHHYRLVRYSGFPRKCSVN